MTGSRDVSRRKMVEATQLKDHERIEDDRDPTERALRGTWQHPNPSLIFASNPRFTWRFIKRYGIILVVTIILWLIVYGVVRWSL